MTSLVDKNKYLGLGSCTARVVLFHRVSVDFNWVMPPWHGKNMLFPRVISHSHSNLLRIEVAFLYGSARGVAGFFVFDVPKNQALC